MEPLDILTMRNVYRLLVLVILFGYNLFSVFLMLRIRILAQTLKTKKSALALKIAQLHMFIVFAGSILVGILILL
jgi:hypothetical protein